MNVSRVIAMGLCSMAIAAGATEILPAGPTERDVITLRIQRSFTEDCLWKVTPTVRREGGRIDVTLDLHGEPACDQALTDRTFEIPLGSFPPGNYVLWVRWSDGQVVESRPLTVSPVRAEGK